MHCLCEGPLFEHIPVAGLINIIRTYSFERSVNVMNDIINSMPPFKLPDGSTRLIINWYSHSEYCGMLSFTNLYIGGVISILFYSNDKIQFSQEEIYSLGKLLNEPIPGPLSHYLAMFASILNANMFRCHEI